MTISQVIIMTTASLLASLALSSPLVLVTKLEVRKNLFSDTETSFCYEVNMSRENLLKFFLENSIQIHVLKRNLNS